MLRRLAVLMDPIQKLKIYKDSTFAMLLEAQRRDLEVHCFEQADLGLEHGRAWIRSRRTRVRDDVNAWFEQDPPVREYADAFDCILLRKDPPFDAEYLYDTQILERAEAAGVLVVNRPQALRDANEKLFTALFPQCCPPTLVARQADDLRAFAHAYGECVIKVLDAMGGASIFRIRPQDPNLNVILETITLEGRRSGLIQQYVPDIVHGDKRILLIDGEPVPFALARIPREGEFRGNLARGGSGRGQPLSDHDRWICAEVGPELKRRGLIFVGLDVIGDYLTEVNVTSPTCIRELDAQFGLNIAGTLFDRLEGMRG